MGNLLAWICQSRAKREERRIAREINLLNGRDFNLLSKDEQSFVRLAQSRLAEGLPVSDEQRRRIDEIGERLQADAAW